MDAVLCVHEILKRYLQPSPPSTRFFLYIYRIKLGYLLEAEC